MIYSYIIIVVILAMRAPWTCTQLFIGRLGRGGQPVSSRTPTPLARATRGGHEGELPSDNPRSRGRMPTERVDEAPSDADSADARVKLTQI